MAQSGVELAIHDLRLADAGLAQLRMIKVIFCRDAG